ncbi:MAG: UMP kinase [Candidatus Geothermarchaeales archaeon]
MVKVTGYLFEIGGQESLGEVEALSDLVEKYTRERNFSFHLVTGGGPLAREYIEAGRRLGADETLLDQIGITFTRVNARLLISSLGDIVHSLPLRTLEEVVRAFSQGKVTVSGGLYPGISTNAVSTLTAEALRADLLVTLSRSGALFDKDPAQHEDAKPLTEVTPGEIREILRDQREKAGEYPLLDVLSLNIIARSRIPTIITSPTAEHLEKALNGQETGTRIVFEDQ